MEKIIYVLMLILAVGIASAYTTTNISVEGQLLNSSGNILTGSHNINVTIYNTSNAVVYSNKFTASALDSQGRFFKSLAVPYNFNDQSYIAYKIDNNAQTAKTRIGYVPYAINALNLGGKPAASYVTTITCPAGQVLQNISNGAAKCVLDNTNNDSRYYTKAQINLKLSKGLNASNLTEGGCSASQKLTYNGTAIKCATDLNTGGSAGTPPVNTTQMLNSSFVGIKMSWINAAFNRMINTSYITSATDNAKNDSRYFTEAELNAKFKNMVNSSNITKANLTQYFTGYRSTQTWTIHDNYPAACPAGQYATQIGDTLTCDTPPTGGGGASKWVDVGTYIEPNATYAANINVKGNINATYLSGKSLVLNGSAKINNANLTIQNGNIFSQPITGAIGSGIIWAAGVNNFAEVNVSCTNLNCRWGKFQVHLVNSTNAEKICNISAGTRTVTNNVHSLLYIDNKCVVQETTMQNYINMKLSPGGYTDFANIISHSGETENINGIGLENKRMIKLRKLLLQTMHLDVVSGFDRTVGTFPHIYIAPGSYVYLMDIVSTTKINTTGKTLELVAHNGTGWAFYKGNGLNMTSCDSGSALTPCTNTAKYRRYFLFDVGYNDTANSTELHQLAASNSITYTSVAECLDTVTYPLTYAIPSFYQYGAVMLYVYCGRPTDSGWTGSWIDLRTVKQSQTVSGTVDLSVFLRSDGTKALLANWDAGAYNITASYFIGTGKNLKALNTSFPGNITKNFYYKKLNDTITKTNMSTACSAGQVLFYNGKVTSCVADNAKNDSRYFTETEIAAKFANAVNTSNITKTNLTQYFTGYRSTQTWTIHDNYPAACGAGLVVQQIGDTLTCVQDNAKNDSRYFTETEITTFWNGNITKNFYYKKLNDTITKTNMSTACSAGQVMFYNGKVTSCVQDNAKNDSRYFTQTQITTFWNGNITKNFYYKKLNDTVTRVNITSKVNITNWDTVSKRVNQALLTTSWARFNNLTVVKNTTTGGLVVDTTTLVARGDNDRVGVGTASPKTALHVIGVVNISGQLKTSGLINQSAITGEVRRFSNGCYEKSNTTGIYLIC